MENEFKLQSGEYAKILGITKEALRSRRRRGELEGEYIFENGVNLYRRPASTARSKPPGPKSSVRAKRIGIHGTGNENYGKNYHFKQHNELKMLAKLQRNVDQETQELLPQAIEIAKQQKQKRILDAHRPLEVKKTYGRMIYGVTSPIVKNKTEWKTLFEEDSREEAPPTDYSKKYY